MKNLPDFDLDFLINLDDESELYAHVSDQFNEINDGFYARANRELLTHLDFDRSKRMLDLACGTGHLAIAMAEKNPEAKVVGVDLSTKMLAEARVDAKAAGVDNIEFLERDIFHYLPELQQGDFDLGVSCFALSYLGVGFLLQEMYQTLGPKGQVGITTSSINSLVEWQQVFMQFFMEHQGKFDSEHLPKIPEMPYDLADMKQRLEMVGFQGVQGKEIKIELEFSGVREAASFLIASGWLSNQFYSIRDKSLRKYLLDWAQDKVAALHQGESSIKADIEFLVAWNKP